VHFQRSALEQERSSENQSRGGPKSQVLVCRCNPEQPIQRNTGRADRSESDIVIGPRMIVIDTPASIVESHLIVYDHGATRCEHDPAIELSRAAALQKQLTRGNPLPAEAVRTEDQFDFNSSRGSVVDLEQAEEEIAALEHRHSIELGH